jgi:hypothetical protein
VARWAGAGKQITPMLDSTHLGSAGHRLEGRGCSGERARQRSTTTAATARTPAKIGTGLHNVWLSKLPCDLMEVLEGLGFPGSKQSLGLADGCSAAAAGIQVPASWRLG